MQIADLRKTTLEIIAAIPFVTTLVRTTVSVDQDDNRKETRSTISAQTIRVAELGNTESDTLMEQGLIPNHLVNITARHDADIKKGDRFERAGKVYEIVFMRPHYWGEEIVANCYKQSGRAKEVLEDVGTVPVAPKEEAE